MIVNIIEKENNHTITEPSKPNKAETGKVRVAHLPLFSPTHPHLSERCALARHLPLSPLHPARQCVCYFPPRCEW